MNENSVITLDNEAEAISLDELEAKLSNDLEEQLSGLEFLEKERGKINNPKALGETIGNAIWEQFMLQIGTIAGEDFIKANRNMTLNLRDSAHIQTGDNFKKGKIAKHNYISREQLEQNHDRYKNTPHKEFRKEYVDPGMNETLERAGSLNARGVETVKDIYTGRQISTKTKLENGKNNPQAAQREHVEPSAKVYANEKLQMAYDNKELAGVINDRENLQGYTTAERNNRKSDRSADKMHDKDKNKHWEKANKRAKEHIKKKEEEGIERLRKEGRQTQKEEALRIGKNVLKAVLFGLLADFLKVIIKKLVSWFRHAEKKWSTFVDSFKEAWKEFWANFKSHLVNAGKVIGSTILTAILGPIEKIGTILKMGWSSLLNAISYISDPENRKKPFGILMLEIGKIVVAGLSGAGALFLGEVIEKKLMAAGLVIHIPLLGSLAGIIGMFIGAIVFGIIGALVIRWIDKIIAKKLKDENTKQQIAKQNEILATQEKLIIIADAKLDNTKGIVVKNIIKCHDKAKEIVEEIANDIRETNNTIDNTNNTIDNTNIAINRIDHIINDTEDTIKNISTTMDNEDKETNIESKNIESLNDLFNDLNRL